MSAKLTIKITHIDWRSETVAGGRPFFKPAKRLRDLGFKGQVLKHDDGTWYSIDECQDFASRIEAEAQERERQRGIGSRLRKPPATQTRRAGITTGQLVETSLKAMRAPAKQKGKKKVKPLSKKTVHWYNGIASVFAQDCPDIWDAPAAALTPAVLEGALDVVWEKRGLATTRGVRALISRTWNKTGRKYHLVNPTTGIDDLPMLESDVRFGTFAEMMHLIELADELKHPEIGDSIMLGLFTAQRQGDRLTLEGGQVIDGEIHFRQSKTGKPLRIPAAAPLVERLEAARRRRAHRRINYTHVLLDEKTGRPFDPDSGYYGRLVARLVESAAMTMPSLSGFRDKNLRATGITWMALSGSDAILIASVSGHSLNTVQQMLDKHYLGRDKAFARKAISQLESWFAGQG